VSCGSRHREKEDVSDGAVVADVDGSAIQLQPKEEVFAPPPAEVKFYCYLKVSVLQRALGFEP